MSIKDRIKFFQNLKSNQQPKPLPKPLPKTIHNKTPISVQSIKPLLSQPQIKQIVQPSQQPIHDSSIKQPPKSAEVITQFKPTIITNQLPKELNNFSKNPQKTIEKKEPAVMSVKERLKILEQSKAPIVQQPTSMKSCFIPTNKSPFYQKSQIAQGKQQPKPQERVSMPEKVETYQGQKKLSFQEMRSMAEALLKKTQISLSKPQESLSIRIKQSQQNQSSSQIVQEGHSHQIKVELEQQTEKLDQEVQKQVESQKEGETNSQILFKEALKQQAEPTLVTGQLGNLSLGVRKTNTRKRINDDFDDL